MPAGALPVMPCRCSTDTARMGRVVANCHSESDLHRAGAPTRGAARGQNGTIHRMSRLAVPRSPATPSIIQSRAK